ncbi:hydrophobin-315 [Coprinopsis sp. MPI-PUGE-AT-0042]|nr:hydrophobin-315 [Coprinopsis sp. MPI-PUGE-AT-0042]KAH6919327.1 hydrophobin-315 [Coprinopsis sp. MPI-PUGE-AT-0042]
MFARLSVIALVATLFAGVMAAPTEYEYESCNGGEVQCCNSAQTKESMTWEHKTLMSILKIDIGDVTGLVGVGCSGVNVAGIGGGSKCTQQKVCCSNNNFKGVVALGCTPINISL